MRPIMRAILLLGATSSLGSCVNLGAKPMLFECPHIQQFYAPISVPPEYAALQADGLADILPQARSGKTKEFENRAGISSDAQNIPIEEDGLYSALMQNEDASAQPTRIANSDGHNMLLLSGGSQWGAYGAGYLSALQKQGNLPKFTTITGVSTGALQAILVGSGDFVELEKQYRIKSQSELVDRGDEQRVINKGYYYDPEKLRIKVENLLCTDANCSRIRTLARNTQTRIFVGAMELATGQFRSFDISAMARAAFPQNGTTPKFSPKQAQNCITAALMGSVAVPVFLRPASINGRTFVDGGVRYSVYEAGAARIAEAVTEESKRPVTMYVVRNGPTVLRPDSFVSETDSRYQADAKPDAGKNALRSYSAIVNQSEVMAIAALRLSATKADIRYTTANGYYAQKKCVRTKMGEKVNDDMFDPKFMECLMAWGDKKATAQGWQILK